MAKKELLDASFHTHTLNEVLTFTFTSLMGSKSSSMKGDDNATLVFEGGGKETNLTRGKRKTCKRQKNKGKREYNNHTSPLPRH